MTRRFWLDEAWEAANNAASDGAIRNEQAVLNVGAQHAAPVEHPRGNGVVKTVRRDSLQGGRVIVTPTRAPSVRYRNVIDAVRGMLGFGGSSPGGDVTPATLKVKAISLGQYKTAPRFNSERAVAPRVDRNQVPRHPMWRSEPRAVLGIEKTYI